MDSSDLINDSVVSCLGDDDLMRTNRQPANHELHFPDFFVAMEIEFATDCSHRFVFIHRDKVVNDTDFVFKSIKGRNDVGGC